MGLGPIGALINGHTWDFSSIELIVGGVVKFTALQEVNYESTRDRAELRGTSVQPLNVTRGQTSHEGSIVIAKQDEVEFLAILAAAGKGGIMDGVFNLDVNYSDPSFAVPAQDSLEGCRLNSISNAHSQGSDVLTVSYDIYVARIKYSGFATDDVLAEGLAGLIPALPGL